MKKHTKIYLNYWGYQACDVDSIPCDLPDCDEMAVDTHHIYPRGMGGDPSKDVIENLIALDRKHHFMAETGELSKEYLRKIIREKISEKNNQL